MPLFGNIPQSNYPPSFIPKNGKAFVSVDKALDGSECTVKGFRDVDGVLHIQSVEYAKGRIRRGVSDYPIFTETDGEWR